MQLKTCTTCNIEKDIINFSKMKNGKYGVRSICKECASIEARIYRETPERKQISKDYYQNNKIEFRQRMNRYRMTLVGQYHEYLKSAKKRNYEFFLTKEECKQFYNTNCYYCNGQIHGLGIDRVDNNKGYILNNCVPCCYRCNIMKNDLSKEQFLNHITRIIYNMENNNA